MVTDSKKKNKIFSKDEISLTDVLVSLNSFTDSAINKSKKIAEDHSKKVTKFNQEFQILENSLLIPSMSAIIKTFNASGHGSRTLSKSEEAKYFHIRSVADAHLGYYFQLKNTNHSFTMLIRGNSFMQKVIIEFCELNGKSRATNFSLNEISKKLIESQIANEIDTIISKIKE